MHHCKRRATAALLVLAVAAATVRADFAADVEAASKALERVLPGCGQRMTAGDFAGANQLLLDTFPAKGRTTAQAFLLGNALFDANPTLSYGLHQEAARARPKDPLTVWEWALEQHRAGQWAGALAAYEIYSAAKPRQAVSYAMQADCLLRLGKVNEAVEAWAKSEAAPDGSIETMEDMVCTVHRDPPPHQRRADLLARAVGKHDVAAAADLIALDCDWPKDWWNGGPQEEYLSHDGPAVAAALRLPPDDVMGRAMGAAAECATAANGDPAAVHAVLAKHHLLLDDKATVPPHGGLLTVIIATCQESKAMDDDALHKLGPKVLELARRGHDAALWNVAANLAMPPDVAGQVQLERDGWQATGDARFAGGVLFAKAAHGQLHADDPDLAAALKQFPQNGVVQRANVQVASHDHKLTRTVLAAAAEAEFTHFSSFIAPATVIDRPRSNYLRQYFSKMATTP